MVNLEQIRLLESRVQHAISYVQKLRDENVRLRSENSSLIASLEKYEKRINDLENVVNEFKAGQEEIEQSINSALKQLDRLEDKVLEEGDGSTSLDSNVKETAATETVGKGNSKKEQSFAQSQPKTEPALTQPPTTQPESFSGQTVDVDEEAAEGLFPVDEDSQSHDESESELDIF